MIPVTKSFFPPIEEYMRQIERVYQNQWLTNRGELVKELEDKLTTFLKLSKSKILATNNGTVPIQIALKLLGCGGEIITTPFSYIATTSSIVWENCTPVFVDIHPEFLTIDETKIEEAITDKTTCILATHVFGNPCNVEVIEKIADKYGLKVIYDAAHAFGVEYKGKSIFEYGDISTCSFHATKLFHTGEGGAIFCKDDELQHKIFYSHNFGHDGPLAFHGLGINAKISELQSAMGLAVLPYMDKIMKSRHDKVQQYDASLNFQNLDKIKIRNKTNWNYSYYPVLFKDEASLLNVEQSLNKNGVIPRRYFYPSLNTLDYLPHQKMNVSESISKRILCLPIYNELKEEDIQLITKIVNQ